MDKNYDVIILRRPGVVVFTDIIKIVTMFIKTITKYSRKVPYVFLDVAKFVDFW